MVNGAVANDVNVNVVVTGVAGEVEVGIRHGWLLLGSTGVVIK